MTFLETLLRYLPEATLTIAAFALGGLLLFGLPEPVVEPAPVQDMAPGEPVAPDAGVMWP